MDSRWPLMAGGWAADARGSAAWNHFSATRRAICSGRQDQSRSVKKLGCHPIADESAHSLQRSDRPPGPAERILDERSGVAFDVS
jgi:hypothetical protein